MKKVLSVIALVILAFTASAQQPLKFDDYFEDKTLRVDYYQTGDADELYFSLDQLYLYDTWAGNPDKLIDSFNSGMYYVKLYDVATNRMIYSRGFATIFGEYRTTHEAQQGEKRSFHETVLVPMPKFTVNLVIEGRNRWNILEPLFITRIDPKDVNIIQQKPDPRDAIFTVVENGHPHNKVDLVFVGEGYVKEDREKFFHDIKHFTQVLFSTQPFQKYHDRFNVRGVLRYSAERGVDEPTKGIFRNTAVSASYNALNTPRYLLIDDNRSLRDIAGAVPYDYVIVVANINRYGGGGIYNNYTIFTADDKRSEDIFRHEFGHGFANLADEYFGNVAYNEFFPPGVEPHEPNITRLLNPNHIKWQHLLTPGIPIPTPWGQEEMDSLRTREQKEIAALKSQLEKLRPLPGRDSDIQKLKEQIAEIRRSYQSRIEAVRKKYLEKYKGKIGVFEGAGYSPKGIYRSEVHIGMFYNGEYGPVSEEAIEKQILHLSN